MNIPAFLASKGAHSVERGKEDVIGVLENQYHCGPSLCHVTIVTNGDTATCISGVSVSGRGGTDPNPNDPAGIIVYPGDTITISGSSGPCATTPSSDQGSSNQGSPSDTSSS
jgi:hypothetical protein